MEKAHSNQNYNGNAGVGSKGVAALITVRMMQQHDILMYSFWHDSHAIMLTTILIPSTPTNQAHPLPSIRFQKPQLLSWNII